jgi:hydrogenase maturation factor
MSKHLDSNQNLIGKYKTLRASYDKETLVPLPYIISPYIVLLNLHLINIHVSYSLHLIDCNVAYGEYVLIPEQGVAQEVVQEPAPEPAIEDLPALAVEGKPQFYA